MRPLTETEIRRVPQAAKREWRPVAVLSLQGFGLVLVALFAAVFLFLKPSIMVVVLALFILLPMLSMKVFTFVQIVKAYRSWRRELQADLAAGVAEEKLAKVYDRFRAWSVPTTFVLWAECGAEGLQLNASREVYEAIQPGDSIKVTFLPRSQLVVGIQKE